MRHILPLLRLWSHLQFPLLQQILTQGHRRQQRRATQKPHVALLPLVTAAERVLVAHSRSQASGALTGAHVGHPHGRRNRARPQAAPQRPRVVCGPVTADL